MIPNENVYVLANRPGPFADLGVPLNPNFNPLTLSSDEQYVHHVMYLDYAGNDFYLTSYFAAVLSMPDIQFYFSNPTSFDLSRTPPTGATVTGGSFLNNPKLRSYYTGLDNTLPLGFNYQIQYYAPGTCLLTCLEKQISTTALCQDIGNDPTKILRITWPTNFPFAGILQLQNQTWGPGAEVDINVRPHQFPFYQILQSIQYHPYVISVIQQLQLMDEYQQAIDSVEKISYILVAILMDRKVRLSMQTQITA